MFDLLFVSGECVLVHVLAIVKVEDSVAQNRRDFLAVVKYSMNIMVVFTRIRHWDNALRASENLNKTMGYIKSNGKTSLPQNHQSNISLMGMGDLATCFSIHITHSAAVSRYCWEE